MFERHFQNKEENACSLGWIHTGESYTVSILNLYVAAGDRSVMSQMKAVTPENAMKPCFREFGMVYIFVFLGDVFLFWVWNSIEQSKIKLTLAV